MMESQTNLEKKFVELEESKQTPKNSRPKIQRVAEYLRNRTNLEEHYSPKLVSIGPIHHDNTNLKLGEKYKLMWAAKYIENNKLNPEELHKKIADNIDELKNRFSDDVLTLTGNSHEDFGSLEEKLSWMLFVDGCSLLYILEKAELDEPEHMNIKVDQLVLVMMDVLLLENQLPYEVLKLLWKDNKESELIESMTNFFKRNHWAKKEKDMGPNIKGEREHSVSITNESQSQKEKDVVSNIKGEGQHSVSITNDNNESGLIKSMRKFIIWSGWASRSEMEEEGEGEPSVSITNESPTHLLDLQRQLILGISKSKTRSNEVITSKEATEDKRPQKLKKLLRKIKISRRLFPNIKIWSKENSEGDVRVIRYRGIDDLRAVGIRLKSSLSRGQTDIDFSEGWLSAKLTIPFIPLNNYFAAFLLNMIAYEMSPDFENDYGICSYVAILDSLIDHSEDVKALRSKGILSTRWSDEEVAKLFNIIGTDLVSNIERYVYVQVKIVEHYNNKYKSWIALGLRTYFSNPWTVIAFLAAFIALALTFIQTLFTIQPASK